ncbi:MAG: succinate dehydrogenase (quinone) flavoprotein subunit, partial [Candidatus Omnitrophica bacterium]|nr:succinate dehydrogenase (quinone) flavoprotein subunit [Candidatus Omnitrophota bacterium]
AYSALSRNVGLGRVKLHSRTEMLELVLVNGHAKGIITRDLITGKIEKHSADAVVLATGGYGNVFFLSTNAVGCNVTATYRAFQKGALFANPCYTQIHPTCIPVSGDHQSKLTLMSESLRNDGRIWVPSKAGDQRKAAEIPETERDYYLERKYPSFGNLCPRDIASRSAKEACDSGQGVGSSGLGVYLDFKDAIGRLGEQAIRERYGNLFHMYEKITGENPYQTPMRIYPAVHYTMGGLWVDYNLMSNIPGLFVAGEANFSDHGANRLGASALMQGLADGYFVLPYTIGNYLATQSRTEKVSVNESDFIKAEESASSRIDKLLSVNGAETPASFHKRLGHILWDKCGMARSKEGLEEALKAIPELKKEFWSNVKITGKGESLNQCLERAGRVADFLEFGELMSRDAHHREESCGGHFRVEHQTEEGEAKRDDENFSYVGAWQYQGENTMPKLHKEELKFENVKLAQRSYK